MSETWVDAEDYEDIGEGAYDSEDIREGAYDSEDAGEDFGEESRSARRRRERQRQIMLARQRQAQMRRRQRPPSPGRRPVGAPGQSRPTITAIRSLDLETKVGLDSLRRAVEESNRRANRATWAAVAGAAVDQGLEAFSTNLPNQYVRAGARFAPLLFLSPAKKKGGAEGFVTDPRFIGGASILGIALLHNFTSTVHSVRINPHKPVTTPPVPPAVPPAVPPPPAAPPPPPPPPVPVSDHLEATAKDRLGNTVQNVSFAWKSSNPKVLTFTDSTNGEFTAMVTVGTTEFVDVTVTANGKQDTLTLPVGP